MIVMGVLVLFIFTMCHGHVCSLHLFMVALCNRADHYIFALWFLSFFFLSFFFLSSPNLSSRRLDVYHTSTRFTAFSLPGQFAPRSESANRTLANSLPGTFAPWPICSVALSLPGTWFWPCGVKGPRSESSGSEMAWERKGQGASWPGSESARVLLADSLQGANWPGSEKARYHRLH